MAELKTTFEDIHLSDEGTTLLREAMSEPEKDEQDHLKTKGMSKETWGSMLKKRLQITKKIIQEW